MAIYYDSKPVEVDTTYDPTSENAVSGVAVKEAIDEAVQSMYKPGGSISFSNLPVLSADVLGFVYNITDAFTTDARFVEGAGTECAAGTNVVVVNSGTSQSPVYKFDILAAGAVQVQSDWTQTDASAVDYIKNKPIIPTVNDATLTISQNGVLKGTFSANSSTNVSISLDSGSTTAEEIVNANEATGATNPLKIWQGTEQEWTNGKATDWYNWRTPLISNFTTVGSLSFDETTQTATGFGSGNYIEKKAMSGSVTQASSFEIGIKFTYISSDSAQSLITKPTATISLKITTESKLSISLGNDSSWSIASGVLGTNTLESGKTYSVKLSFNGSVYKVQIYDENTSSWIDDITINSSSQLSFHWNTYGIYFGSSLNSNSIVFLSDTYYDLNNGYYTWIASVSQSQCYTLEAEPTTASTVYSAPDTISALTVTSVGTGTITLSDNNTYTYTSSGDVTTYQTIGDAYPNYLANIEDVGVKIGNTLIADNTDTSGFLSNSSRVPNCLTLLGDPTGWYTSINIGALSQITGNNGVAIGVSSNSAKDSVAIGRSAIASSNYTTTIGEAAQATAQNAIAIGTSAKATAQGAVQIGGKTNTESYTLYAGQYGYTNYKLLDFTTGKIPTDRLITDTTPTSGSTNPITSGAVYDALGNIEATLDAIIAQGSNS